MSEPIPSHIGLMSSDQLARCLGYSGTNSAFRDWCASMRITPVPGRRGYFDPVLVRRRLDEAQGLTGDRPGEDGGLVAARRARRAAR